ncbi:hypothetical protein KL86PLE_130059 [uncultured Pleomorphomonas sp.]|uniref:Uncharacterized protein n=1 Tax=uncultured Pleomorphomonas sp. TaxID=442121 RepID=A0A212L8Z3_9HYPH|nr:hypothetical protein KL86PLE_130059 [uncultured Pleomorphomonas sp.]
MELKWIPENDLDAHFNLTLHQKKTTKTKREKGNDRLAIQDMINQSLNGIYSFDYKAEYGDNSPSNIVMPKKGRIYE